MFLFVCCIIKYFNYSCLCTLWAEMITTIKICNIPFKQGLGRDGCLVDGFLEIYRFCRVKAGERGGMRRNGNKNKRKWEAVRIQDAEKNIWHGVRDLYKFCFFVQDFTVTHPKTQTVYKQTNIHTNIHTQIEVNLKKHCSRWMLFDGQTCPYTEQVLGIAFQKVCYHNVEPEFFIFIFIMSVMEHLGQRCWQHRLLNVFPFFSSVELLYLRE